ncbi:hypothetical protein BSKO_09219 [Bryopsis sp. KO-2023]|nr:hypothetical protein BSKO_09219 [Bryopsis sp. KO-2023]
MPQESYLEKKLRQLGLSQEGTPTPGTAAKKVQFKLYFPRAPYGVVEYSAARQGDGLNFVGQLLGHGGSTLKRIQQESGTRVEVHDGRGNLNGLHPSYTDPSLHAIVYADSREKLVKAARLIADVLQPLNTTYEKFTVSPGGSALLKPRAPLGTKGSGKLESVGSGDAWKMAKGMTGSHSGSGSTSDSKSNGSHTPTSDCPSNELSNVTSSAKTSPNQIQKPWKSVAPSTLESDYAIVRNSSPQLATPVEYQSAQEIGQGIGPLETRTSGSVGIDFQTQDVVVPQLTQEIPIEGMQGIREWDTWGKNHQEPYNQFTAATQSFFSEYANRSKQLREMSGSVRSCDPFFPSESTLSPGGNVYGTETSVFASARFPSIGSSSGGGLGMYGSYGGLGAYESAPLPDVYSELVGRNSGQAVGLEPLESSRLLSHYNVSLDREQNEKVDQFMDLRHVPFPRSN